MKLTFENWYKSRFGHDFGGVADEDCDLESCWKAAANTAIAAAVEAEREACAAIKDRMLNGCHNRPPRSPGHYMNHRTYAADGTFTVAPRFVPDRMSHGCGHDKKATDAGCKGCKWATLPGGLVSRETPIHETQIAITPASSARQTAEQPATSASAATTPRP